MDSGSFEGLIVLPRRRKKIRGANDQGKLSFDYARLWESCFQRWHWILFSAIGLAVLGGVWGYLAAGYTATVTLIRTEQAAFGSSVSEGEVSRGPNVQTLIRVMRSADLLQRLAAEMTPPVTTEYIASNVEASPVENTDLVRLSLRGKDPGPAVNRINLYAQEALRYIQELHSNEIRQVNSFLKEKLRSVDQALGSASEELLRFQQSLGVVDFDKEISDYLQQRVDQDLKSENLRIQSEMLDLQIAGLLQEISKHHPALLLARQELDQALLRYTEEHLKVQELRARVGSIEAQIVEKRTQIDPEIVLHGNSLAKGLYTQVIDLRTQRMGLSKQLEQINLLRERLQDKLRLLPEKRVEYAKIKAQHESLKSTRDLLINRQRQTQLNEDNPAAYYRIFEPARVEDLSRWPKVKAGAWAGTMTGSLALIAACLGIMLLEISDRRIRSEADLRRATKLPILATLGDLTTMTSQDQEYWALKTLAILKRTLGTAKTDSLVCGFVSSRAGEGRSTWVGLLAGAASKQGYRVLTIATNDPPQNPRTSAGIEGANDDLFSRALSVPSDAADAVLASWAQGITEVPLAGVVWNLERQKQWQRALQHLTAVENLVVLIELPPVSQPEALLLAKNIGQLVWLCGRDLADVSETRSQMDTLRRCRGNLAGAVFNRATAPAWRKRFGHLTAGISVALFSAQLSAQAPKPGETPLPPKTTNESARFSASSPAHLADWQKRLTLGPGDVLQISLYEQPDSLRLGLTIGPDGRLNYLQARDVIAAGLTVDELREKLENVLSKFYRPPLRTIIVPQGYHSKKYYILGNVVQKGVFSLDRPTTIMEAIAKAQGFMTTLQRRNTLMLADLSRSFLVRHGEAGEFKKLPVDFEGLFLRGDLSQNIELAPEDYLYFPPLGLQELYVLGEVPRPGVLAYTPSSTAVGSIIARGGFTERSFRRRILVVRGSLNHPQTFIVNASDILAARSPDFTLEPRDIVYVSRKPWSKAEELLESAITDFFSAAVIAWTGQNVGPFIKEPIIK